MTLGHAVEPWIRRREAFGTSEARQMLEHAIDTGRGGVYLKLTPDQYGRLRRF